MIYKQVFASFPGLQDIPFEASTAPVRKGGGHPRKLVEKRVSTLSASGQGRGGGGGTPGYSTSGPGVSPGVKVEGNTIALMGTLPEALRGAKQIAVYAETAGPGTPPAAVDQVPPGIVTHTNLHSPEVDLSGVTKNDGPFPVVYEAFHHAGLPRPTDMAATVIRALGDRFDFFVWYSDFRIDNQEAGTPSTGPRGGKVTGTGQRAGRTENYGSAGRLQWMYVQPVYIGSNQGQERSPDGKMTGYNYAMSQVAHELAHNWTADATAKIGDETLALGPTHWGAGCMCRPHSSTGGPSRPRSWAAGSGRTTTTALFRSWTTTSTSRRPDGRILTCT